MADKQISYQIVEFGAPLKEAVSPVPPPGKDEILVRVTHCGICHSDVHFQEGHFDLGDGLRMEMKATMKLPMTPGHEVVGVVEKTGADVKRVKVGDQVALYPLFGCKECSNCEQGLENLCNFQKFFGNSLQGGFSTHVLAKEEQAVPFRGINPAFAATCCCSGITTFSSIKRLGRLTSDDKVLFIGAGGLGLMALQLFKVLYPSHPGPVFADIDQARLDFVMSNGASEAINLKTDGKVVSTYMKMAWIGQGFTGILDFVGSGTSVAQCAGMLNKGGRAIIVGLFGGAAKVPAPLFPLKGITISGNFLGPRDEFEELFRILEGGKITPPPIFLRPLSDAPEALEELRKGKVVGRTVLKAEKGSSL